MIGTENTHLDPAKSAELKRMISEDLVANGLAEASEVNLFCDIGFHAAQQAVASLELACKTSPIPLVSMYIGALLLSNLKDSIVNEIRKNALTTMFGEVFEVVEEGDESKPVEGSVEFEMSDEHLEQMNSIVNSDEARALNSVSPIQYQVLVNEAWTVLGREMGFVAHTAKPIKDKEYRHFTAVPIVGAGSPN